MRYRLLLPALAIAAGCHKTSSPTIPPGPPTFQFTANGRTYTMNGNLADSTVGAMFIGKIGTQCISTDTMYYLEGRDAAGDACTINTEPITFLAVATYRDSIVLIRTDPDGSTCSNSSGPVTLVNISSKPFICRTKADYSIITVTSLHQGLADGSFSAHLTLWQDGANNTLTVTDGRFTNIPVMNP